MNKLGLYLNDLNAFDGSSEMIVTEMQYLNVLQKAVEKQHAWTLKLKETKQDLNKYSNKSKSLLYSMLPKHVARQIENGVKPNSIYDVNVYIFKVFFFKEFFNKGFQSSYNYVFVYNGL